MAILTVAGPERPRYISFQPGPSLREILDATDVRVRSGCRGTGACGLCLVRIEAGALNEPTPHERLGLTGEQIRQGTRLACQAVPMDDLRILLLNPAPASQWRSLVADEYYLSSPLLPGRDGPKRGQRPSLGVAVDLGTTHISATLWDTDAGKRLAGRVGKNQQIRFGADVITRITAAAESGELAGKISQLAVDSIGEALFDIASREGFNLQEVTRVSIVGNTPELALLTARNHGLLLQPKFWTSPIDCRPGDTRPWLRQWRVHPDALVEVIAPLAGFVGSDLLAGILATAMTESPRISLLVDFGTNSEIALWDGTALLVTSAAGGPAFEGSGLASAMPAEPGAVYRIDQAGDSLELALHVLGDEEPRGLCGSGLVDLIASLVRAGVLDAKGKFTGGAPGDGYRLPGKKRDIVLGARDVDLFQRAKAAIGAGIEVLLRSAALTFDKIERVFVSGAFGSFLNVSNAQRIGLLPPTGKSTVDLCGNTALAGCETLLTSPERPNHLESIRTKTRIINLARCEDFEALFMTNLYLRPMETA